MSVQVDLKPTELALLRQLTNTDNDAQAVARAALEFVRLQKLRELKTISGKVDFDLDWQALEALELSETVVPN